MNSSSFISANPIYSRKNFLPVRPATRFGWSIHGSGRVCPESAGSGLKPSDIDSAKSAFMSGTLRTMSSSLRGPFPQALALLEGARFFALHLR